MRISKVRPSTDETERKDVSMESDSVIQLKYDYKLARKYLESFTKSVRSVMADIDTLGALTDEDVRFVETSCIITVGRLETLIDVSLQLCYLLGPLKQSLNIETAGPQYPIKVSEVLKVLQHGDFYRHLKNNLPKCIINNRTTSMNVEILKASLLIYVTHKLSLEQIREALLVFTLEEHEHEIEGVFMEQYIIMNLLKAINKTIGHNSLKHWISTHKFRIPNFIMPYEFLYLGAQCHNRDVYLRRICKFNFKNIKMPNSNLYMIQPAKDIAGSPDHKIQQQLLILETQAEQRNHKQKAAIRPHFHHVKSHKTVSKLKELLRNYNIYKDIKSCLAGKEKSEQVKECLAGMQQRLKTYSRPFTSMAPIDRSQHTEEELRCRSRQKSQTLDKKSMKGSVKTRPVSSIPNKTTDIGTLCRQYLSHFDLNKLRLTELSIGNILL